MQTNFENVANKAVQYNQYKYKTKQKNQPNETPYLAKCVQNILV